MSAPTSLQQTGAQLHQRPSNATGGGAAAANPQEARLIRAHQNDLIEAKFNQLAKKILAELHNPSSPVTQKFFLALDTILQEPPSGAGPVGGRLSRSGSRKQIEQQEELARKCDILLAKQRMQQDQIDSHQQILFDKQYESLPSEVTGGRLAGAGAGVATASAALNGKQQQTVRGANEKTTTTTTTQLSQVRRTATTSQLASPTKIASTTATASLQVEPQRQIQVSQVRSPAATPNAAVNSQQQQQQKRSAIPTSTILSGINQLSKSATTGNFAPAHREDPAAAPLARQASFRTRSPVQVQVTTAQKSSTVNSSPGGQQQLIAKPATSRQDPKRAVQLGASEKLKQRRPTKASVLDNARSQHQQSIESDDDDDDDDDDSYEYQDLASRRAYLNQRFIEPTAPSSGGGQQVGGGAKQVVAKSKTFSELKQEQAAGQAQASSRPALPSSVQSGQVRRQSAGHAQGAAARGQTVQKHAIQMMDEDESGDEEDDDDDFNDSEGPRSINGLLTSQSGNMMYKPHMNYSQSLLGNHRLSDDDEIIIIPTAQSPTPSLLMSASPSPIHGASAAAAAAHKQQQQEGAGGNPHEPAGNLDEFNERFSISRTKSFWEKLASSKKLAGGSENQQSLGGQQQQQTDQNNNNTSKASIHQQQHSNVNQSGGATNKMANQFERLDSTGGSGNSHYSGCSSNGSTSGDEQAVAAAAALYRQAGQALARQHQVRNQQHKMAINPKINQLVQQEQLQRSDKFRQTR